METLKIFHLFFLLVCCCYAQTMLEDAKEGCPNKCGNVNIPYPFGSKQGCFLPGFETTWDNAFAPPILFSGNLPIIQISQGLVLVNVTGFILSNCYSRTGQKTTSTDGTFSLTGTPFTFSDTRNKFTVIGCDTVASITDSTNSSTGCLSVCGSYEMVPDGECSGTGCCTSNIAKGLQYFESSLGSFNGYSSTWDYSSCGYAYLLDQEHFNFYRSDLKGFLNRTDLSLSWEWAIGNETCDDALKNSTSFACRANKSQCVPSSRGSGYLCNCTQGYYGNPYLVNGCKDVNECLHPEATSCVEMAKCVNTEGSYFCECPAGTHGNGTKEGTGCTKNIDQFLLIKAILGSGLVFLFLLVSASWTYWGLRKRKGMMLKERFFKKNGGLLLQQKTSSHVGGGTATVSIFTPEEVKEATNNYDNGCILGSGGFGTVYKGILKEGTVVAIKKSKVVNQTQIEQFINEVIILSQINHRNVVKLLGCCFETQIPILVYEFISNGTLSDHIHHDSNGAISRISWDNRMRIAIETAEALAYLHSATSVPIFHMDIKLANILLDEFYTAKVADFGASRLVPLDDETNKVEYIQGTLGYLDPEYLQTYCSTDKSDVYSFGVVLVELLTGKKKPTLDFLSAMKENSLEKILEARVLEEGTLKELQAVADLAKRCLHLKGEERPTMKEVAQELGWIKGIKHRPWVQHNQGETELLLGDFPTEFIHFRGQSSSQSMETFSIEIGAQ